MPEIKDKKLREKQSNYWHPIKGAAERWKSSWEWINLYLIIE